MTINQHIARELDVPVFKVDAAVRLLDDGATVPFIARYRKEATGGLDDTQLRELLQRLHYLRELEERRTAVLASISEQGKLNADLEHKIKTAATKAELEDLYAPYKPKRRNKAVIAREAGIEPLLDALIDNPNLEPELEALAYCQADAGFADAAAVLEGARYIAFERVVEHAALVGERRSVLWAQGLLCAQVVKGQEDKGVKFQDYFEYQGAINKVPSHRALALFRGRTEGILRLNLSLPGQDDLPSPLDTGSAELAVAKALGIHSKNRAADGWLMACVRLAWRAKLAPQLETELFLRLKQDAEQQAISVFGENLRDLLLAAPAGDKVTLGLDPGFRSGVKVVVVDATGKLLAYETIYPHQPQKQFVAAAKTVTALMQAHKVGLISIGNGTASRETEQFVQAALKGQAAAACPVVVTSEAGASVYSASELAAKEFPDLDVSIRGAVSIARRLQDPLAELVKIDPKAIGVGQYQHDVNQTKLAQQLTDVVEDCVNAVGVDLNTASAALLQHVSGLSPALAHNIVLHRETEGRFESRKQLLTISRLGPKAYQQAAGFLRITQGENPLDASSVHPEAYSLVKTIAKHTGLSLQALIANQDALHALDAKQFVSEKFGEPTVLDVLSELEKPGRDPRPEFKTARFKEGVDSMNDLEPGAVLEGCVTNVTNFGAFVDIGVHQDGLVHISALSTKFVSDPRTVVKTGQVVKVKVVSVDVARKRIALTLRLDDDISAASSTAPARRENRSSAKPAAKPKTASRAPSHTALSQAFSRSRPK